MIPIFACAATRRYRGQTFRQGHIYIGNTDHTLLMQVGTMLDIRLPYGGPWFERRSAVAILKIGTTCMKIFPVKKILRAAVLLSLLASARQNLFAVDGTNTTQINFDRDIRPIFENNCLSCHGPQKPKSNYRLDYREGALAGGDDNTNDIVPGDSRESKLIAYVARQVPEMEMPPVDKGTPLTTKPNRACFANGLTRGRTGPTTNQQQNSAVTAEPVVGGFIVHGNERKIPRDCKARKKGLQEECKIFPRRSRSARMKKFR